MGVSVILAGQDITLTVQEPSIMVESALGQGAGVPGQMSGRATTASFLTSLGPAESALGAGQVTPGYQNLFSAAQSNAETDPTVYFHGTPTLSIDTAQHWQGNASLKVVTAGGTNTYEQVDCLLPVATYTPGATYTFSVYLYTTGGGTLRVFCEGDEAYPTNGRIGNATTVTLTNGAWQRLVVTVTMPNPITYTHNIGLRLDTGGTPQALTFWLDGFQCEKSAVADAWILGGTTSMPPSLVRQGEVSITDGTGTKTFGGYVTKLSDVTDKTRNYTKVDCHDYWQDLDRVLVNKVYVAVSDTYIINDLVTTYAPWISLSQVNTSVNNYTFTKLILRSKTLMAALQKVADVTGFDIWVDVNKNLRYVQPTNLGTAAFAISDNPDMAASYPCKITKYEQDDNAVINRVTFYGGKKPTPDFTQDISSQANGVNTTFILAYYPRESSNGHIQVLVNNVQQVVGYANSSGPANTLKSAGGTADVLVNSDAQNLTFNTAPATGASVKAIYRYDTPLIVQMTSQQSYNYFGRWFDGSIADTAVFDSTTAITRCRLMLAEQAYGLTSITLTCWQPGLVAGTQLRVDNTVRNIHNTYIIQRVKATAQGGGFFIYEVDLGAWNWQLADLLLAAARYTTHEDTSTNETTTPLTVQGLSQNVAIHTAVTTITHISSWYYARATAVGDGHDAYCGFFTVNSVLPTATCSNSSPGLSPGGFGGRASVIATGHVA